ncbi:hypothetical protein QIG69_27795, partial [Klebsiella pneumoniae]|nr:hypothetical protein [Klebsiella pneumoniae]
TTNAIPNAAPSTGNDNGTVTVTVRAEAAARSGMLDITLGDGLELVSVASPALLSGYKQSGSTLTFGYAGIKTIE